MTIVKKCIVIVKKVMHSHDEENEHSHDEESEQSHDEESEHSHDDKEYDEHIWTSPVNAMKMVGYICDE